MQTIDISREGPAEDGGPVGLVDGRAVLTGVLQRAVPGPGRAMLFVAFDPVSTRCRCLDRSPELVRLLGGGTDILWVPVHVRTGSLIHSKRFLRDGIFGDRHGHGGRYHAGMDRMDYFGWLDAGGDSGDPLSPAFGSSGRLPEEAVMTLFNTFWYRRLLVRDCRLRMCMPRVPYLIWDFEAFALETPVVPRILEFVPEDGPVPGSPDGSARAIGRPGHVRTVRVRTSPPGSADAKGAHACVYAGGKLASPGSRGPGNGGESRPVPGGASGSAFRTADGDGGGESGDEFELELVIRRDFAADFADDIDFDDDDDGDEDGELCWGEKEGGAPPDWEEDFSWDEDGIEGVCLSREAFEDAEDGMSWDDFEDAKEDGLRWEDFEDPDYGGFYGYGIVPVEYVPSRVRNMPVKYVPSGDCAGDREEDVPSGDCAGDREEDVPSGDCAGNREEDVPSGDCAGNREEDVPSGDCVGDREEDVPSGDFAGDQEEDVTSGDFVGDREEDGSVGDAEECCLRRTGTGGLPPDGGGRGGRGL
jgi:hypothetical protein